ISWKLYDNKSCSAEGLITTDGPVSVSADGAYETPKGASPTASGTYYWVASYSGDANNKEASSGCAEEPVVIGQASPSIETTQNPAAGIVGATYKDNANLARSLHAALPSTISWKLYDNKSCSAEGLITTDGPVS